MARSVKSIYQIVNQSFRTRWKITWQCLCRYLHYLFIHFHCRAHPKQWLYITKDLSRSRSTKPESRLLSSFYGGKFRDINVIGCKRHALIMFYMSTPSHPENLQSAFGMKECWIVRGWILFFYPVVSCHVTLSTPSTEKYSNLTFKAADLRPKFIFFFLILNDEIMMSIILKAARIILTIFFVLKILMRRPKGKN